MRPGRARIVRESYERETRRGALDSVGCAIMRVEVSRMLSRPLAFVVKAKSLVETSRGVIMLPDFDPDWMFAAFRCVEGRAQ